MHIPMRHRDLRDALERRTLTAIRRIESSCQKGYSSSFYVTAAAVNQTVTSGSTPSTSSEFGEPVEKEPVNAANVPKSFFAFRILRDDARVPAEQTAHCCALEWQGREIFQTCRDITLASSMTPINLPQEISKRRDFAITATYRTRH